MDYIEKLEKLGACQEALEWLRQSGHKSLSAAWKICDRPDWMLWLLGRKMKTREHHAANAARAADAAARAADAAARAADAARAARAAARAAERKAQADIIRSLVSCPRL